MLKNKKVKIAVAHPGKQMSYQLSSALNDLGYLHYFYTSFYVKNNLFWKFVLKLLPTKIGLFLKRRRDDGIPDKKVKIVCPLLGFKASFYAKKSKIKKYYKFNRKLNERFGKKVSKSLVKNNIDIVISSAINSLNLFSSLTNYKKHVVKILEMPILAIPYTNYIFRKEIELYGDNGKSGDFGKLLDEQYVQEKFNEIKLADNFLVPSTVTKNSLIYCGVAEEKIKIAMYSFESFKRAKNKKCYSSSKIRFLYVGNVNANKGVHHLLNCFSRLQADNIELTIVGTISDYIKQNYLGQKNVNFLGFVDHSEISKIYENNDVFVFPSLSDGFSHAVAEAMQFGLAVVCSNNAGISDFVSGNGITFNPLDENELFNILNEIVKKPSIIEKMGVKCQNAVFTRKDDYKSNILSAFDFEFLK